MAKAGVSEVAHKTLMRHEKIQTTHKHYVDPRGLELHKAVEELPTLGFGGKPVAEAAAEDGLLVTPLVTTATPSHSGESVQARCDDCEVCDAVAVNASRVADLATKAGETEGWLTGLEPATPRITI